MQEDDETSATQLQAKLASLGVYVSLATIVCNRVQLGWTYRGSAYCKLRRHQNKEKRLEWARTYLHNNFNDETTVQLGEKPRSKPRAKHPTKVHVWAGISRKAATKVCIFEGIMAAPLYCEILQQTLQQTVLPFIQEHFPPPPTTTHRFMQDNDPKHTSRVAQQFYTDSDINWWKTPAESPDINPIESTSTCHYGWQT